MKWKDYDKNTNIARSTSNENLSIGHKNIQGLQTLHMSRCHDLRLDGQIQQLDVPCLTEIYCNHAVV